MWAWIAALAAAGPHTALVGVQPGQGEDALRTHLFELGAVRVGCQGDRVCIADFKESPPFSRLRADPTVRFAEPDHLLTTSPPPPDSKMAQCPSLWEAEVLDFGALWQRQTGAWAPTVAIVDSGFLTTHQDLAGAVAGGYDYGDRDELPEVSWAAGVPGHGTFIAALIAAPVDGVGRDGIAPNGRLYLQKIADSSGAIYESTAVMALLAAAARPEGTRVVSYSLASSTVSQAFREAVDALADADVLLVAAAGNCSVLPCTDADNDLSPLYPASFPGDHILSVGGSDPQDQLNPYSHYGRTTVDLLAPGVDLCSAGVAGDADWTVASGTSYAAPFVAGAAALLWEAHPALSAPEVAEVLRATVAPLGAPVRSGGRLDPVAAIDAAVPRLQAPYPQEVEGRTWLGLSLLNAGATGEIEVILQTPASLDLLGASEGWNFIKIEPGQSGGFPGGMALTAPADRRISIARRAVESHQSLVLELLAFPSAIGRVEAQVLAAHPTDAGATLQSPRAGTADLGGYQAWNWPLVITTLPGVGVDDESEYLDTAAPDEPDEPHESGLPDDGPAYPDEPSGCQHSAPLALGLAPLLIALMRRKRTFKT